MHLSHAIKIRRCVTSKRFTVSSLKYLLGSVSQVTDFRVEWLMVFRVLYAFPGKVFIYLFYLFIYLLDFQQGWGKAKQVWKPPIDKPSKIKLKEKKWKYN